MNWEKPQRVTELFHMYNNSANKSSQVYLNYFNVSPCTSACRGTPLLLLSILKLMSQRALWAFPRTVLQSCVYAIYFVFYTLDV